MTLRGLLYSFKIVREICVSGSWDKAVRVLPAGLGILKPVLQHGVPDDVDPAFHAHFIHRV